MTEAMIGEIRMWAGNFAPKNWSFCNGQIISIASNTALFSILGTTYGGNGTTTFALPDLQGRVALSSGAGPGLTNRSLGEVGGEETVVILTSEMPAHTHSGVTLPCDSNFVDSDKGTPVNNAFAGTDPNSGGRAMYASASNAFMGATLTDPAGQSNPHSNIQPSLAVSFIICLRGVFPARN
jgi:microcystin-dependent protein